MFLVIFISWLLDLSLSLLQASSDVPLLSNVQNLATRLLATLTPSIADPPIQNSNSQFRIGFITPPFKDSKIPITDHLHAHAFIGPPDLLGWWRGVAYGPLAWYPIEDLIAEIRCVLMGQQRLGIVYF